METMMFDKDSKAVVPSVATIGMFDGVHRGHRFVLKQVCDYAKAHGLASAVITFDRHPREIVQSDWHPMLLTTYEERIKLLEETGVDRCVILPFSKEMAALSSYEFMQLMADKLGVKVLMLGYDNRFGHDRESTFEDYMSYGEEMGMEVKSLTPAPSPVERREMVSSSMIRRLLAEGDVANAVEALGYCYRITGMVVKGEHVGTELGFPTANLQLNDSQKQIPAPGVYAVRCVLEDGKRWMGMMNIGTRPTFGIHQQTLEVHILDYEGNLYGQQMRVEFIKRLRDEQRFDNEEELVAQLKADALRVKYLNDEN